MPVFAKANILQAFSLGAVVGSRVVRQDSFMEALRLEVDRFDFAAQTTPGQGFIPMPSDTHYMVSAGVGRKVADPGAYVLREWRGSVNAYLKREHAEPVESLAVIVYTLDAYLADPDVAGDADEVARVTSNERDGYAPVSHVIVAVLANAGPKPPAYSPGRLVANLAGANKDALAWDADTIRGKAKEAQDYADEWSVVAD
jgi:hypothetical protein